MLGLVLGVGKQRYVAERHCVLCNTLSVFVAMSASGLHCEGDRLYRQCLFICMSSLITHPTPQGFASFFNLLAKGSSEVQGNIAYAIGNFASEDDQVCSEILRVNGFQHLVKLFTNRDPEVCESAVVAIANCLEGSVTSEAASELTSLGIAPLLCQILRKHSSSPGTTTAGSNVKEQDGAVAAAAAAAGEGGAMSSSAIL